MVNRREADAHQCTGTSGSVSGTEDPRQGQVSCGCFDSDRQHFSESLHQSFRGDTFPSAEINCSSTVEMMPGSVYFPNSRASPRQEQSSCRRRIQSSERLLRLDDSPRDIRLNTSRDGSSRCGSVCFSSDLPTTLLLQLELGSSGRSHRCLHSGLESTPRLCESSLVLTSADTVQDSAQGSFDCTSMENVTMIPATTAITMQHFSFATHGLGQGDSSVTNTEGLHNANGSSSVGCMAIIRQKCQSGGLSEAASGLLIASWRDKTASSYDSLFKCWDSWCQK